jgi:hypothetical protein
MQAYHDHLYDQGVYGLIVSSPQIKGDEMLCTLLQAKAEYNVENGNDCNKKGHLPYYCGWERFREKYVEYQSTGKESERAGILV